MRLPRTRSVEAFYGTVQVASSFYRRDHSSLRERSKLTIAFLAAFRSPPNLASRLRTSGRSAALRWKTSTTSGREMCCSATRSTRSSERCDGLNLYGLHSEGLHHTRSFHCTFCSGLVQGCKVRKERRWCRACSVVHRVCKLLLPPEALGSSRAISSTAWDE